jgi:hypothetical protein
VKEILRFLLTNLENLVHFSSLKSAPRLSRGVSILGPFFGAPSWRPLPWHQIQAWRETGAARDAADNAEFVGAGKPNGPVIHS